MAAFVSIRNPLIGSISHGVVLWLFAVDENILCTVPSPSKILLLLNMALIAPNAELEPSEITKVVRTDIPQDTPTIPDHLHHLALQVRHNLEYEHQWTRLKIHIHSPVTNEVLPRPLISGLPPKRLYIHPDEQVELLKAEADRKKNLRKDDTNGSKSSGDIDASYAQPELEWVLPAHLREKWSLRKMAEVFDGISNVPPDDTFSKQLNDNSANVPSNVLNPPNEKWRSTKRVVLATVSDDSTITYYIMHDGLVKPRQN
jgi:tRNA-splicing endonuclease subunit Sen15